jgi:hypothetical protein
MICRAYLYGKGDSLDIREYRAYQLSRVKFIVSRNAAFIVAIACINCLNQSLVAAFDILAKREDEFSGRPPIVDHSARLTWSPTAPRKARPRSMMLHGLRVGRRVMPYFHFGLGN